MGGAEESAGEFECGVWWEDCFVNGRFEGLDCFWCFVGGRRTFGVLVIGGERLGFIRVECWRGLVQGYGRAGGDVRRGEGSKGVMGGMWYEKAC